MTKRRNEWIYEKSMFILPRVLSKQSMKISDFVVVMTTIFQSSCQRACIKTNHRNNQSPNNYPLLIAHVLFQMPALFRREIERQINAEPIKKIKITTSIGQSADKYACYTAMS
jgi:hypothetical protein